MDVKEKHGEKTIVAAFVDDSYDSDTVIGTEEQRQRNFIVAALTQHINMAEFCNENNISKDTARDLVNRSTVLAYLRFCKKYRLNPFDLSPMDTFWENRTEYFLENLLMAYYCNLNVEGRDKVIEYIRDLAQIEKYNRV